MQATIKQLDEIAPKIDQGVRGAASEIGNRVNKALDEFEPPASTGVVGKPKKTVANELEAPKGNDLKGAATQLQNNRTRLPRKNGNWINGEPGNGYWSSDIKDVNIITGGKPIKFSNGRPDFSPWSKGSINFKPNQLDGTSADFDAVYKYIAKQKGLKSKNAAKNLLKELGLTPHHSSGTVIQLVPTKLHGNIPHIGSASDLRKGI